MEGRNSDLRLRVLYNDQQLRNSTQMIRHSANHHSQICNHHKQQHANESQFTPPLPPISHATHTTSSSAFGGLR